MFITTVIYNIIQLNQWKRNAIYILQDLVCIAIISHMNINWISFYNTEKKNTWNDKNITCTKIGPIGFKIVIIKNSYFFSRHCCHWDINFFFYRPML